MERKTDTPAGRRRRSPKTDSLELKVIRAHRRGKDSITQIHNEEEGERFEAEVNLILIAHPENELLGTRYQLSHGGILQLGRSSTAEISLPDVLSVSRNHARVDYSGDSVVLEDLGSTNGTYVNDEKIPTRQVLQSGDRIQTGAVHFKFLHERDVEAAYHEAIYNLMMRDGLTTVYNKRKFEEELHREVSRARRYERPLSLILLDLDHFKQINDRHGHLCGDFVLKGLSARAQELLRAEEVLARVGGEEFAVLCPEADTEASALIAERLRVSIAEKPFRYGRSEIEVTCSFGVAGMTPSHTRARELYEAADRALYRSKREGRNQVTVAPAD